MTPEEKQKALDQIKANSKQHGQNYKSQRPAIGPGVDKDLENHRNTGAVIYKFAGWQKAGLTKVDWGRASFSDHYFIKSFEEAAKNASAIIFDVTNFDTEKTL